MKNHSFFERWTKSDAVGDPSVPIELLLLVFFKFAGRGFTNDDLKEANAIDAEIRQQFIHKFVQYGSTYLWNANVIRFTFESDANYNQILFAMAGFSRCIGSVDRTHVITENCADWAQNLYKGYKLNKPSRNYNVTCNHMR